MQRNQFVANEVVAGCEAGGDFAGPFLVASDELGDVPAGRSLAILFRASVTLPVTRGVYLSNGEACCGCRSIIMVMMGGGVEDRKWVVTSRDQTVT